MFDHELWNSVRLEIPSLLLKVLSVVKLSTENKTVRSMNAVDGACSMVARLHHTKEEGSEKHVLEIWTGIE